MNEEQFSQSVKTSFEGFQPEVPSHIYAGIQEKMQTKRKGFFLGWSLNAWLLLLGIAGVGAVVWSSTSETDLAAKHQSPDFEAANIYMLEKAHRSIEFINGAGNKSDESEEEIAEEFISCKMMAQSKSCSANLAPHNPSKNSNLVLGAAALESANTDAPSDAEAELGSPETESIDDVKTDSGPIIIPVVVKKVVEKEKESENND